MAGLKNHGRQYDLVIFGATGYTGQLAAEHVTTHLPTDLKWAIAGRSRSKLEGIAAQLKSNTPVRRAPDIEICELNDGDLGALAKKTFILISTVGPYSVHGEHAFKACAESGTHYLDSTGEVPWVARMVEKYDGVAKANGAMMFPQIGLESAPADLVTWSLCQLNKSELGANTRDVTISVHRLDSAPSGGTLNTIFTLFDVFSLKEIQASHVPFALSPVPNPDAPVQKRSLLTKLTGLKEVPNLGLLTTAMGAHTDAAIVERSWGLMSSIPSRKDQFYGPNFSWSEFAKPRNWFGGILQHYIVTISVVIIATMSPVRAFLRRLVYQPGEGPDRESAKKDRIEYRGVANPDSKEKVGKQAFVRAWFDSSAYYLTGTLLTEAARTILQEDLEIEGGVLTASCLGQPFLDRLDSAGFKMEKKMIPV